MSGDNKHKEVAEVVNINSLVKVSTFAGLIGKTAAWVHRLAQEKEIDMIQIDGVHFVRVNDKFRKYVK